jgi:multidrug efflux pump
VLGGMVTGTILAVVFVPVFFVVIRSIFKDKRHPPPDSPVPPPGGSA